MMRSRGYDRDRRDRGDRGDRYDDGGRRGGMNRNHDDRRGYDRKR